MTSVNGLPTNGDVSISIAMAVKAAAAQSAARREKTMMARDMATTAVNVATPSQPVRRSTLSSDVVFRVGPIGVSSNFRIWVCPVRPCRKINCKTARIERANAMADSAGNSQNAGDSSPRCPLVVRMYPAWFQKNRTPSRSHRQQQNGACADGGCVSSAQFGDTNLPQRFQKESDRRQRNSWRKRSTWRVRQKDF